MLVGVVVSHLSLSRSVVELSTKLFLLSWQENQKVTSENKMDFEKIKLNKSVPPIQTGKLLREKTGTEVSVLKFCKRKTCQSRTISCGEPVPWYYCEMSKGKLDTVCTMSRTGRAVLPEQRAQQ